MKSRLLTVGLTLALVCAGRMLSSRTIAAENPSTSASAKDTKGFKNVGVEEFDRLRADGKAVVLDVRTAEEFKQGHIPGAVNLDVNGSDFRQKAAKLDPKKTYLVHCAAGRRSAKACNILAPLQFTNLYNLEEGFGAWEKAGKPVKK